MRIIILTAVVLASLAPHYTRSKPVQMKDRSNCVACKQNCNNPARHCGARGRVAFLSRPDRVMNLSASLLDMKPISRDRILPLDAIPMRLS